MQEGELELSHQLAFAVRDLETNYVLSQTAFNRRIAAQRQVEAVAQAYETDTITLDVLLQAQQTLAQAESDYFRRLVDYNRSIAQVHYPQGVAAGVQWGLPGRGALAGQGVLRRPPPGKGTRSLHLSRLRLHAAAGHEPRADRTARRRRGADGGRAGGSLARPGPAGVGADARASAGPPPGRPRRRRPRWSRPKPAPAETVPAEPVLAPAPQASAAGRMVAACRTWRQIGNPLGRLVNPALHNVRQIGNPPRQCVDGPAGDPGRLDRGGEGQLP